jgi:WD40 repeat protein
MSLDLKCLEWLNLNKSARTVQKSKKAKEQAAKAQKLAGAAGSKTQKAATTSNAHDNNQLQIANYLLQITGSSKNERLGCLSADKIVNVYDQSNLRLVNKIGNYSVNQTKANISEIGFFKQNSNMMFSCTDQGKFECWDLRTNTFSLDGDNIFQSSICFNDLSASKREFLCADVNADDSLVIVGTNKGIDDALVYIYDIRVTDKYLFKFSESHSNDLSQVRFDPFYKNKFCSSSLDGLICLYDLEMKPGVESTDKASQASSSADEDGSDDDSANNTHEEDPDFMEQVLNADSSVQKIGYVFSYYASGKADQLYAITYTNDFFVWDLKTYDTVYKKQSKNKNITSCELVDENDDEEEDYYFGCFYFKPEGRPAARSSSRLTVCMGDKNGCMKLYQNESVVFETDKSDRGDASQVKRYHRDIIRSSYWNGANMFTAGEDGFLFKWEISSRTAAPRLVEKGEESEDERVSNNKNRGGKKYEKNSPREPEEVQKKKKKGNDDSFGKKNRNTNKSNSNKKKFSNKNK